MYYKLFNEIYCLWLKHIYCYHAEQNKQRGTI